MNCKQGDLAVFVKSESGNEGKIIKCLRLATMEELVEWNHRVNNGPVWFIDQFVDRTNSPAPLASDRNLKPLRDNPGTDETLTWTPVPIKLKEKA